MIDPHVESLRYKVVTRENFSYRQPPPIEVQYPEFSGRLEEGILICSMKQHYSAVTEAEKAIQPHLRAWEIWTDIKYGRKELRFEPLSKEAIIVDQNSSPPGLAIRIETMGGGGIVFGGPSSESAARNQYPDPPMDFKHSPDVETLYHRYEMYLEGKEPLPSMGYFCLTVLFMKTDGKHVVATASKLSKIHKDVLKKLSYLTSKKGDSTTARKALPSPVPLSDKERAWVEAAVKMVILRVGETHSGKDLSPITMSNLPTLDP